MKRCHARLFPLSRLRVDMIAKMPFQFLQRLLLPPDELEEERKIGAGGTKKSSVGLTNYEVG